jgi:sugar-specific transcriptional regulator TrmB
MSGSVFEQVYCGQRGPSKTVDVSSLAQLQNEFKEFARELSGEGKDCYTLTVKKAPEEKARLFPRFKTEVQRGGSLRIIVNSIAAIEWAHAQCEENKKHRESLGFPAIG